MTKGVVEVKYKPTEKQQLAHDAEEKYILYGGALRGGKTVWLCNEAIRQSLRYDNNAGFICRQKLDDFKKTTLQTLLEFLPSNAVLNHHQTDRWIKLVNGSIIYYGGLGDDIRTKERLGGLELGWFGVDQAEEITENQLNLLTTRLTRNIPGIYYHGFLTANPQPGWLRDRFIDNSLPNHRFIPALPKDNPHLPPDYEAEQRRTLPEALVRQLMDGMWDVDMAGNYLIPYSQIREAIDRKIEAEGEKVAGVDIAREGNDESVFVLRQGNKVIHIEAWAHQLTDFSAGKIARLIREYKPVITYIDAVGVGAGAFDPLYTEGFAVEKVDSSAMALDKEIYVNKRAEYFNLLAKKFKDGTISIPDDPKLASQLASLRFHFRGTKLLMESKEVMRHHGVKSPDYADALMYCFINSDIRESMASNLIPVRSWG